MGIVAAWTAFFFLLWEIRSFARGPQRELNGHQPNSTPSSRPMPPGPPPPPDRVVVMGRSSLEDRTWVKTNLADWQHAFYNIDGFDGNSSLKTQDGSTHLREPRNKGREAVAYLTYLVQHYDTLPATIVFLPPNIDGYDLSDYHAMRLMRHMKIDFILRNLNIDYIQHVGYANLRCTRKPGCPAAIQPFRDPPDTDRPLEAGMRDAWVELFNNTDVPEKVATPCCSQFVVSREMVWKRGVAEYKSYLDWLKGPDVERKAKLLEYLWHVIFGQNAVHCPDMGTCYCYVYQRCLG